MANEPYAEYLGEKTRLLMVSDGFITIKTESVTYEDFQQYLKHYKAPGEDFDSMINYANWCANRNIRTYIYPDSSLPWCAKLIINFLLRLNQKIENISKLAIVRCPDHV